MQIICRILQLSDISIMAVERDKSRREGILLRMSTRDSVPFKAQLNISFATKIKIGPQCVRVATAFLFALVCEYDVVEYVQLF